YGIEREALEALLGHQPVPLVDRVEAAAKKPDAHPRRMRGQGGDVCRVGHRAPTSSFDRLRMRSLANAVHPVALMVSLSNHEGVGTASLKAVSAPCLRSGT